MDHSIYTGKQYAIELEWSRTTTITSKCVFCWSQADWC